MSSSDPVLVRGGRLILEDRVQTGDLLLESGRIAKLAPRLPRPRGARIIEARGRYVFPGAIDPHVHHELNLGPGRMSSDTFVSGSRAALHGGVTTMFDFAHQERPGETLLAAYRRHRRKSAGAVNRLCFHAGVMHLTADLEQQIAAVARHGVKSFKLYLNRPEVDSEFLFRAFRAIRQAGGQALLHCEDGRIVEHLKRQLHRHGNRAAGYIPASRPAGLEFLAIAQAAIIAQSLGTRLYIVHVSSRIGGRLIEQLQRSGAPIAGETCPHYLLLTDRIYARRDGHVYTCTPPLRRAADTRELWRLLRSETLACVSTDHCPFHRVQKDRFQSSFTKYVYGLPGVEIAPVLMISEMRKRKFGWPLIARLLATNAAKQFSLYPDLGVIRPGARADLFLYHLAGTQKLSWKTWRMNCDFNQFEGRLVRGRIETVILDGRVVKADG